MNKIVFLDVDGVLNGHQFDAIAASNRIDPRCVDHLNTVLDTTGCDIVLSSAWRYMIIGGAMTLQGFEYLLRTHGVHCKDRLVDYLGPDDGPDAQTRNSKCRGRLVQKWVNTYKPDTWVVIDDLNLGFDGMPFVQTKEDVGLTRADVDKILELLNGRH
jgi:hypothetical protein